MFETSEERLRTLLALGNESDQLDYKESVDLRDQRDKVEFAKDVGAFRAKGGHIVVGAKDDGSPGGLFAAELYEAFDEATVHDILGKYLPLPIGVSVGRHVISDTHYAIVHIDPSEDGVAIFLKVGEHPPRGGKGKKPTVVFRPGDVFVRSGTQSKRWQPHHLKEALERVMATRKERWLAEHREELAAIVRGTESQRLAQGPVHTLDGSLDSETFEDVVIEQVRQRDLLPIKLLLEHLGPDLQAATDDDPNKAEFLLDRVAIVGALGIRLDERWMLTAAIDALHRGYQHVRKTANAAGPVRAAELGLSILLRVYALGALAVRRQRWLALPELATRESSEDSRIWIRDAQIWAARANLLEGTDDAPHVISRAAAWLRDHPSLRRDEPQDEEALLDSLLRFDLLAAIAAMWRKQDGRLDHWYPNFVHFYGHRVEPALDWLISDHELREAVGTTQDAEVAAAIRLIEDAALNVKKAFSVFFGFKSPMVRDLLAGNPPNS